MITSRIASLFLAGSSTVACLAATDARACGEVMYRMGGALRYQAFVSHHPAQILIYSNPAEQHLNSQEGKDFVRSLEKAGHSVFVADSPDALTKALASHPYDVIIAMASDLPTVSAQIVHAASEPSLLPVIGQRDNADAVRKQYHLAIGEDANLGQFLKSIEKTMKDRGA
jgi:hypothetical protein